MELIYTDEAKQELGILNTFSLDYEISAASENTFEIKLPITSNPFKLRSVFYCNGEEYGGIVDNLKIDTSQALASVTGRTWRGVLEGKLLAPLAEFYHVESELNQAIASILSMVGLTEVFEVSTVDTGVIADVDIEAYTNAHQGILKVLSKYGYKLKITNIGRGSVKLEAVPIVDYTSEAELIADKFEFVIQKSIQKVNHLIATAQIEDTLVVLNRYIDDNGNVSDAPFFTGINEIAAYKDFGTANDLEVLEMKIADELLSYDIKEAMEVSSFDLDASLGDKFLAEDTTTGMSVEEYVVKVIVTASNDGFTKTQYEVGETIL